MRFCLVFLAFPLSLAFFFLSLKKWMFLRSRPLAFHPNTKHMNHFYSYSDGPLNDTAGGFGGQMCVPILRR